ncbi:MAG: phosphotransferase family protein [bacterium]|nr:phosphotransferase family protein [bacterium]MDE0602480.1 phosphotransferase family protein [bacterium]
MEEVAGVTPELIEVRADERLDEARLAAYLHDGLPGSDLPLTVRQFARGKANLTYLLIYGDPRKPTREYVLRRPPLGPVAPGSHDMAREYRVLSTLWRAFPLAARAFLFCDDESVLGAPFFVMERRRGVVVQGVIPPEFGGGEDPGANRKLSEVVVDTLAEFHAVDPDAAGLGDMGYPEGFMQRQLQGWLGRWRRARHETNSLVDELSVWLEETMPASPQPTLLHNDWRLDNMAVDPGDPGRCVAVYDWDMCTRGDPFADVGTLMACWFDLDEQSIFLDPMPTRSQGFMTRSEAILRYGRKSGRDISNMNWYLVFGTFKMAVILQQIYIRWLRGQTKDDRFSRMGIDASLLFELAADRRSA